MDIAALRPLLSATALSDVAVCQVELVAIGVVRGLLDARELDVVRRLDELAATDYALFPQGVVAAASKTSLMSAERLRDRAGTCDAIPELGDRFKIRSIPTMAVFEGGHETGRTSGARPAADIESFIESTLAGR